MERDKVKSVSDLHQIKFLIPVLYLQEIVSVIALNMQALRSAILLLHILIELQFWYKFSVFFYIINNFILLFKEL